MGARLGDPQMARWRDDGLGLSEAEMAFTEDPAEIVAGAEVVEEGGGGGGRRRRRG